MSRLFFALPLPLLVLAACGGSGDTAAVDPVLLTPDDSVYQATAPDTFRARFATTQGDFVVEVYRDWAPIGVDRFYNLVRAGYYDDTRFFRVIPGFMAQFGVHGDPAVNAAWAEERLQDDPVRQTNARGTIVFATAGPNTRTTQLFINFAENAQLDGMGFAPFGRVIEGMPTVDLLYGGYGEGAPSGRGPDQQRLKDEGNAYLDDRFPDLDGIESVTIES